MSARAKVSSGDDESRMHRRRRDSPPMGRTPRLLPVRGWIGMFLVLNIFAIAAFIFMSAIYFPSASPTEGLVEHAIKQGDMSLLELPSRTIALANATDSEKEQTASPTDVPSTDPQRSELESKSKLRREPTQTTAMRLDMEVPRSIIVEPESTSSGPAPSVLLTKAPPNEITPGVTTKTLPPATTSVPVLPATKASPVTTGGGLGQQQSITDLLRRMKGTLQTSAPPQPPQVVLAPSPRLTQATNPPINPNFPQDRLVLWLKADEGVEVENKIECDTLGTGCDVITWTSVARQRGEAVPLVFHPVDPSKRPKLVSGDSDGQPVLSFVCPMVNSNENLMHDRMTVFFVISPFQATPGDTYFAQKFFGNEPYGQFLLHGGKPAYYSAGGLRESASVITNGDLATIVYRLHRNAVEIKPTNQEWSPITSDGDKSSSVHVSGSSPLSVGNVKGVCDTSSFQGQIAEILVFDSVLLDDQVGQVERYLQRKWGKRISQSTPLLSHAADNGGPAHATGQDEVELISQLPTEAWVETPVATTDETPAVITDEARQKQVHPRTFDPEGVFEWMPEQDLLAAIANESDTDPTLRLAQWKSAVREKIDSIRNFELGGEVLRTFIRSRRDELLALREQLFGSSR